MSMPSPYTVSYPLINLLSYLPIISSTPQSSPIPLSLTPAMSLNWGHIIPSLAQRLGYNHLQDWQAHLTQKVLDGNDVVLTAGTGRGKSTLLLAPLLAKREVDSKAVGLSIIPTKALGEDQVCVPPVLVFLYAGF
jgi:ATP-dependent helicase YprA (DUF1998 family)